MLLSRLFCRGALLLAFFPALAVAATGDPAALRAELDAIYQRLLVDPSDKALNRRMIDIALALEDYDAAIGAVERLIFYDPSNAALQLEAARLYLQIKSYAAAAGYLKDAVALPGFTDAQLEEIAALIKAADRGARGSPWSGFGQVGVRYQTNANIGSVELGLNEPFPFEKPEPDWNTFALGTLGLDTPLNKNVSIEGSLSGYYADQRKVDRLDLGFAELAVGPRFSTEDGALSVKPYGLVQGILLGDAPYQFAYGARRAAALGLRRRLVRRTAVRLQGPRPTTARSTIPTPPTRPAKSTPTRSALGGQISDNVSVLTRAGFNDNYAAKAYQSYDQYFANVALQIAFDAFGKEGWSFSPFATISYTDFEGIAPPEEFAGFKTMREEVFWGVGANFEVPLRENIALGLAIEYNQNQSNVDRDDYENLKFVIGPQGRF